MDHEEQEATAKRATPEIRALAGELAKQTADDAWFEPFEPDDPWLLSALVRAFDLGRAARWPRGSAVTTARPR
jgi:hypothetical protein